MGGIDPNTTAANSSSSPPVNATQVDDDDPNCCANFFTTCFTGWHGHCARQLVAAVVSVFFYLVVMAANYGIVFYENVVADTYRTLINKVVALMSLYNMLLITGILPMMMSRQLCSHYGPSYCHFHTFFALALTLQVLMVHNELAALLQLRTWRHGSIQAINEDIWRRVLLASNAVLSCFFSLVMCVAFGKNIFIFRMCMGECSDAARESSSITGDAIVLGILALTVLNHLTMGCRMLVYKRKKRKRLRPIRIRPLRLESHLSPNVGGSNRRASLSSTYNFVSSSLVDHKTTTRTVGLSLTLGPFVFVPMGYFWSGILVDILRFGVLSFALLFLPVSMYIGKKHLRITIWREAKAMWYY